MKDSKSREPAGPYGVPMQDDALTISCFGVPVEVRMSAGLSRHLPVPLIPGAVRAESKPGVRKVVFSLRQTESADGGHSYTVSARKKTLAEKADVGEAVAALQSYLHEAVARRASDRIFVHAGVVGWQGKAILIPGRSCSGKSTLIMALVDAGATYYSDEYAVLDGEGRVHPYNRIPQLRSALGVETALGLKAKLSAVNEEPQPLPAGLVLLSKFQQNAKWRPSPLTTGEALLGLVRNTVAIRKQPEVSMCALAKVAHRAKAYKTIRAEARDAAAAVLELCGSGTTSKWEMAN